MTFIILSIFLLLFGRSRFTEFLTSQSLLKKAISHKHRCSTCEHSSWSRLTNMVGSTGTVNWNQILGNGGQLSANIKSSYFGPMNKRKSLNILIRGIILKNKICQMCSHNCRWIVEECFYEERQISFFSPIWE